MSFWRQRVWVLPTLASLLLLSLAFIPIVLRPSNHLPGWIHTARYRLVEAMLEGPYSDVADIGDVDANNTARHVVYISDREVMASLGCPLDHGLSCFYEFIANGSDFQSPAPESVRADACSATFTALTPDRSERPWCIRQVRIRTCTQHKSFQTGCLHERHAWFVQGKQPTWLHTSIPEGRWRHESAPVLVTGCLSGPNPTHQVIRLP